MTKPSLAGRWHLVAATSRDDEVPEHRVDLVFHEDAAGLRGAVLSRIDESEVPLQSLVFDGVELRLQMPKRPDATATDLPFLVMTAVGDHFEGHWSAPAVKHIPLKLIRFRE